MHWTKWFCADLAWNSSDCFESFFPLNNDVTEGVITTRSNRMKFRLVPTFLGQLQTGCKWWGREHTRIHLSTEYDCFFLENSTDFVFRKLPEEIQSKIVYFYSVINEYSLRSRDVYSTPSGHKWSDFEYCPWCVAIVMRTPPGERKGFRDSAIYSLRWTSQTRRGSEHCCSIMPAKPRTKFLTRYLIPHRAKVKTRSRKPYKPWQTSLPDRTVSTRFMFSVRLSKSQTRAFQPSTRD